MYGHSRELQSNGVNYYKGTFRICALYPNYDTYVKCNDVGGTQDTCIGNN
jgi:hypothetical protein